MHSVRLTDLSVKEIEKMAFFRCSSGGGGGDILDITNTEFHSGTTGNPTIINTTRKPIGIYIEQWNQYGAYTYFNLKEWDSKYFVTDQSTHAIEVDTTHPNAFAYSDNSITLIIGANYNYRAYVLVE